MPESNDNGRRLDSWKDIATYLKKDVRTVIRWEKTRGLPVHRVPGGQRNVIFAYRHELDAWLRQGKLEGQPLTLEAATAVESGTIGTHPARKPDVLAVEYPIREVSNELNSSISPRRRTPWKNFLLYVGAIVIIAAMGAVRLFLPHTVHPLHGPARIGFSANSIEAFDDAGNVMWAHQLPKTLHQDSLKHIETLNSLVRIADLYGDGGRETLVTLPLQTSTNPNDPVMTEIDCFSSDGTLRWSYLPQEKFRFGTYDLDGPWLVWDVFISAAPKPTIWAALGHYRWGNSFVVQLDPITGKDTVRFVNTGTLYKLNEAQIAGRPYLLIGGFNNEYAAGILAAVDETRPYAVSPQTAGTRHKCVSCGEGVPDYYFVFPRSEINRLRKSWEDSVRFINVRGENIEIEKAEMGDPVPGDEGNFATVHVVYDLHADSVLRVVAFRFDSAYDIFHRELQNSGKLDHPLESCSERLRPDPVREWSPSAGWTPVALTPVRAAN